MSDLTDKHAAAFEVRTPDGNHYKIWETGMIEGFPEGSTIVNRIPLRMKPRYAKEPEDKIDIENIYSTTEPDDGDIVPVLRGMIRKLAICRNILKGCDLETASKLAGVFAKKLIDVKEDSTNAA